MSIRWTKSQHSLVQHAFDRHPVESGRCRSAASEVLPVASEADTDAHALAILPDQASFPGARYVDPDRRWYFHVNVAVFQSRVDAMTGADGAPASIYLQTFFPETFDAVTVERIDLATWSEP
jgi:hypothetical protein